MSAVNESDQNDPTPPTTGPPTRFWFNSWLHAVVVQKWPSGTADTTLPVALSLLRRAEGLGCSFVRPGQLHLSSAAGPTQKTVSSALRRIADAGLIEREHRGRADYMSADTWGLRLREADPRDCDTTTLRMLTDDEHLWSKYGLGGTSLQVLHALEVEEGGPVAIGHLARQVGHSLRTIQRRLAVLDRWAMASWEAGSKEAWAEMWEPEQWRIVVDHYWAENPQAAVRKQARTRYNSDLRRQGAWVRDRNRAVRQHAVRARTQPVQRVRTVLSAPPARH